GSTPFQAAFSEIALSVAVEITLSIGTRQVSRRWLQGSDGPDTSTQPVPVVYVADDLLTTAFRSRLPAGRSGEAGQPPSPSEQSPSRRSCRCHGVSQRFPSSSACMCRVRSRRGRSEKTIRLCLRYLKAHLSEALFRRVYAPLRSEGHHCIQFPLDR